MQKLKFQLKIDNNKTKIAKWKTKNLKLSWKLIIYNW